MKILLTKKYYNKDLSYLKNNINKHCEIIIPESYDENGILKLCKDIDVFLGSFMTSKIAKSSKKAKLWQIPWTGIDDIDINIIKDTDIIICNSHSNSKVVAEHGMALFLSMVKKIPYHDRIMRSGNYNRPNEEELYELSPYSESISKMSVGIYGYGHIGKKIAQYLHPYGLKINICDKEPPNIEMADIKYYIPKQKDLFYENINALFICLPLNYETINIIDYEAIKKIQKRSYIINVSRADIICKQDLYDALEDGTLDGAALDVWWKDNNIKKKNCKIQTMNNIIMSPHRAGIVYDELPHLIDAIRNINNLYEGKELINMVNTIRK